MLCRLPNLQHAPASPSMAMFLFTTAFTSCIMQGAGPDCDGVVGLSWQHGTAAEAAQYLCICYADGRQDPQDSHCILCEPSGP